MTRHAQRDDLHQPEIAGRRGPDAVGVRDHPLHRLYGRGVGGVDLDLERQDVFVASAQHRQRAMTGNLRPALDVIEIVGEFRAGLLLSLDRFRAQKRLVLHVSPDPADQVGVDGHGFADDVAGALERRLHVLDLVGQVGQRRLRRYERAVGQDRLGERAEAALAGDFRSRAPFGLEGQIDVFQFRLRGDAGDLRRQLVGQLALAANRIEDRAAARVEFAEIDEAFRQKPQLRVVEPAGRLLAIARNERHGRAFIEQSDRRGGLLPPGADLGCDQGGSAIEVVVHFGLGFGNRTTSIVLTAQNATTGATVSGRG